MIQPANIFRRVRATKGPHWAWRLGWLIMLLLHAAPLTFRTLSSGEVLGQSAGTPLRSIVLVLSSVFFALKVIDVRWLRFRTDFRSSVSWLIIISVLHLGILNRAINENSGPPEGGLQIVLFMGGAVAAATILYLLHVAAARRAIRPSLNVTCHSPQVWCAIFRSLRGILPACPRGPPS